MTPDDFRRFEGDPEPMPEPIPESIPEPMVGGAAPRRDADDLIVSVPVELAERRLVDYLALLWPERPRRGIDSLFAGGRVRVAGRPASARSRAGDAREIRVVGGLEDLPRLALGPAGGRLDVLHEDEHVTVLSKPSGLPVIPGRDPAEGSCLGWLVRRELEARGHKPVADWIRHRIVHRIDRLTSGLLITARTGAAERRLGRYLEEGRIRKEYLARLTGEVRPARIHVDCPIRRGRGGRMVAHPRGKPARTAFEVRVRRDGSTIVLASPRTGRTHQIRVHALAIGHPLGADPLYGERRENPESEVAAGRFSLHAFRYTLPPEWPGERALCAPPPADLGVAVE